MGLLRPMSDVKTAIAIKTMNAGLNGSLKTEKWQRSQRKLIKIMIIMNELEGKKGREVFQTDLVTNAGLKKIMGGKTNEAGARIYIDRIEEVMKETYDLKGNAIEQTTTSSKSNIDYKEIAEQMDIYVGKLVDALKEVKMDSLTKQNHEQLKEGFQGLGKIAKELKE